MKFEKEDFAAIGLAVFMLLAYWKIGTPGYAYVAAVLIAAELVGQYIDIKKKN